MGRYFLNECSERRFTCGGIQFLESVEEAVHGVRWYVLKLTLDA
jgi:hypothetical protein